jgi:CHASE3 domain sensor protein
MTQPIPPKTFYEKSADELLTELVAMINNAGGAYQFSPNDYINQITRRQEQESNERANAIAAKSARMASRSIWATIASAIAAVMSAAAAVLALNHSDTPVSPLPITSFEICTDE